MFNKSLSIAQKILTVIVLATVFVFISQLEEVKNLLAPLEDRVIDYQFLIRGQVSSDNDLIRIILIDEDSTMAAYGYQSPTPRPLLTSLVNHLIAKDVAVVGIDILLDRPSYWAEEDKKLADAFKNADGRVVLATAASHEDNEQTDEARKKMFRPLPEFAAHTLSGYSQILESAGGVARQLSLGNSGMPSFVGQVYARFLGGDLPFFDLNQTNILKGTWVDINYQGPPSRLEQEGNAIFPVFSAEEVEFLPAKIFKDKVVFIGSGIDALGDIFLTPFSTSANGYLPAYGVELHALVMDMLVKQNYLISLSDFELKVILFCLFFVVGIITMTIRIGVGIPLVVVFFAGWVFFSVWLFLHHQIKLPVMVPFFGLAGVVGVCFLILNQTQAKQARFLKNTFKRYIPSELVDQLIENPEQINMGGETKNLTVFFSDIENFTTISEKFTPYELVLFLNTYLGRMTDILFEEKGTLDKYGGDAIIAFFGAPVDVKNHADYACKTALRMQQAITVLNEEWREQNKPFLNVRIGINTGPVVVGNIGSDTRSDYTVIGDTANLASRLEGVNKIFGTNIIISQQTLNATEHSYFKRELARIIVKGKTEPITVYQLIDCLPSEKEKFKTLNDRYESVLQLFYNRDFNKAAEEFSCLVHKYKDKASEFMLSQAMAYIENEPDFETWKGEIILTSK